MIIISSYCNREETSENLEADCFDIQLAMITQKITVSLQYEYRRGE